MRFPLHQSTLVAVGSCSWVVATLLFAVSAHAEIYHVALQGDDSASGTQSSPFRSIGHAASVAQPGDTVHVGAGTYEERITWPNSGLSGAPIILEGERATDGSWLTVLDGSEPTSGWVPATEVGTGIFKAQLGYEARCVIAGDGDVPRLMDATERPLPIFDYLRIGPDETVETTYLSMEVAYWDGIEAMHYFQDDWTYLRFRNYEDPEDMAVRASPEGGAIVLDAVSHVIVRDLEIRGAQYAVRLTNDAHDNLVERCHMRHGQARVRLEDGAADNVIRGNRMHMGRLSDYAPGAWSGGSEYEHGVREHIYNVYKHEVGTGTSSPEEDAGVYFRDSGPGNVIENNEIFDTLGGVTGRNSPGLVIRGNEIHAVSSVCVVWGDGLDGMVVRDNYLHNCSIGLRFHELGYGDRSIVVVGNRFESIDNVGTATFWHHEDSYVRPSAPVEVLFAHNSIHGHGTALSFNSYIPDLGLPSVHIVDNVFSQRYGVWPANNVPTLGLFEYNWVGGSVPDDPNGYFTATNVVRDGERVWSDGSTDFVLPADSEARGAGIDLSQSVTLGQGVTLDPAMDPGYFAGAAPHMGAMQDCEPGAVVPCTESGVEGTRTCSADGTRYGDCVPLLDPDGGVGGGAGSGGAGTGGAVNADGGGETGAGVVNTEPTDDGCGCRTRGNPHRATSLSVLAAIANQ